MLIATRGSSAPFADLHVFQGSLVRDQVSQYAGCSVGDQRGATGGLGAQTPLRAKREL